MKSAQRNIHSTENSIYNLTLTRSVTDAQRKPLYYSRRLLTQLHIPSSRERVQRSKRNRNSTRNVHGTRIAGEDDKRHHRPRSQLCCTPIDQTRTFTLRQIQFIDGSFSTNHRPILHNRTGSPVDNGRHLPKLHPIQPMGWKTYRNSL